MNRLKLEHGFDGRRDGPWTLLRHYVHVADPDTRSCILTNGQAATVLRKTRRTIERWRVWLVANGYVRIAGAWNRRGSWRSGSDAGKARVVVLLGSDGLTDWERANLEALVALGLLPPPTHELPPNRWRLTSTEANAVDRAHRRHGVPLPFMRFARFPEVDPNGNWHTRTYTAKSAESDGEVPVGEVGMIRSKIGPSSISPLPFGGGVDAVQGRAAHPGDAPSVGTRGRSATGRSAPPPPRESALGPREPMIPGPAARESERERAAWSVARAQPDRLAECFLVPHPVQDRATAPPHSPPAGRSPPRREEGTRNPSGAFAGPPGPTAPPVSVHANPAAILLAALELCDDNPRPRGVP